MNTAERKQQYSTKDDFDFSLKNYHLNKEAKKEKQENNRKKEKFDDSLKNYNPNKGE